MGKQMGKTDIGKSIKMSGRAVNVQADYGGSRTGLTEKQASEVETSFSAIPTLEATAEFIVEGEDGGLGIMEQDIVTCSVHCVIHRASHSQPGDIL